MTEESTESEVISKGNSKEGGEPNAKKVRLFSAKEFRKQLNTDEKLSALIKFSGVINGENKHQYITEYLDSGGNCLELLRLIETDNSVSPCLVFKIVYHLLLTINTSLPQHRPAAEEACRYLMNTFVTLLNKMLSLNSAILERKTVLQLLTAVVTFSATLAKDVLLHINFNPTNIELLTKPVDVEDSVRNAFINFLTAFLVDGQYPTLAVLLEKRGFLSSIIKGLQFDSADCVCMVMTALKIHVLENPFVSKTVKMKVFSTPVVKDIVNLYNWKGPMAIVDNKKNKKVAFEVDEYDKSKVSQSVHDFLLVLCTSHKYGVIFKDRNLGLGKKHQNSLMYTVLESLDKPWEHSYASELVTKICKACPDLTRTLWSNLKSFMEPRCTTTWLKTVNFAKQLLDEMEPSCIEYCAKDLKISQLAQTIQFLVAPTPILKSIIPEFANSKHVVKYWILQFLNSVLKSIDLYLTASKKWLTTEKQLILKHMLSEHISRNFPSAQEILKHWNKLEESDDVSVKYTVLDYLNVCFDLLEHYKNLCLPLLEYLSMRFDFRDFFEQILKISEKHDNANVLYIKAVSLALCISPTSLLPSKNMFQFVLVKLFESYFKNADQTNRNILYEIFRHSSVFEGCESEIEVWIDGVLNLKASDTNLYEFIALSLKETFNNYNKYLDQISELSNNDSEDPELSSKLQYYLEKIIDEDFEMPNTAIKNTNLSALILGTLDASSSLELNKSIKTYISFVLYNLLHLQTNADILLAVICNKQSELISSSFLEYANSWKNKEVQVIPIIKFKGRFNILQSFSEALLNTEITDFLNENSETLLLFAHHYQYFLHMCMFYFTNSLKRGDTTENLLNNCEVFISHLASNGINESHVKIILSHPVLLHNFSPLHIDKKDARDFCTKFVLYSTKLVLQSSVCSESELYLKAYRSKVFKAVLKVLKKLNKQKNQDKFQKFIEIIETFQLDHKQCVCVLSAISDIIETNVPDQNDIMYNILNYTFSQFQILSKSQRIFEPLVPRIINALSVHLKNLNTSQSNSSIFAKLLLSYLEMFPHNVSDIDSGLFESILTKNEYCKDNTSVAVYLLKSHKDCKLYSENIVNNIDTVCTKKGLILPLIDVIVSRKLTIVDIVYNHFKPSLIKTLQKPQKAGQHFEKYYLPLAYLLNQYLSDEECKNYVQKVQKFDVSEPFHAYLLTTIFQKYLLKNKNSTEVQVSNSILTLTHLSLQLFKKKKAEDDWYKLEKITEIFCEYIRKISENKTFRNFSYKTLLENESFGLYSKFCLKFGISNKSILLKTLSSLSDLLKLDEDTANLFFDMIVSHSEFLDVVLGEQSECKLELLKLVLVLAQRWPGMLKKNHVPVLLATYQATLSSADRCILNLLKICETNADETCFDNFKPLLWGRAAAGHYSVRSDIQSALWRQPKIGDVLNILQDYFVTNTIKNHSLSLDLHSSDIEITSDNTLAQTTYDLTFLLPLFDQLLAPENAVQTYRFTKSGAISLTIVALGSYSENVRKAACHVLSRFYYHVEAKQTGKDNLLWLRFIEAVCKSTAVLEDFMLNSFASIFLARMGLVLTQPGHVMYVPLCQYLGAKSALDFNGIPELYTFLHSSDVNYKDHRNFILEVIRDGLRTERDFEVALRSMAFKLIMELFNSSVCDIETKCLILEVFKKSCLIYSAVQLLCSSYGFLSWLYCLTRNINEESVNSLLPLVIDIVLVIVRTVQYEKSLDISIIGLILIHIVDDFLTFIADDNVMILLLQGIDLLLDSMPNFLNQQSLAKIVTHTENKYCEYLLKHPCKYNAYFDENDLEKHVEYYLRRLTFKFIKVSKRQ